MKVKSKVNKKLYNRLSTMALPEFNCNEPNVCTNAKQQNEPLQEIHFEISFIFRAKKSNNYSVFRQINASMHVRGVDSFLNRGGDWQ